MAMSELREGVENGKMPLDYGMAAALYLFELQGSRDRFLFVPPTGRLERSK
jgi:hypothetical protein